MDLNRVTLMGHLASDVELTSTPQGAKVGKFTVALNRQYKNIATKATTKKVTWVRIVVWGARAEACAKYIGKGSMVFLEGLLENNSWVDKKGSKHNSLYVSANNVKFLSQKKG